MELTRQEVWEKVNRLVSREPWRCCLCNEMKSPKVLVYWLPIELFEATTTLKERVSVFAYQVSFPCHGVCETCARGVLGVSES